MAIPPEARFDASVTEEALLLADGSSPAAIANVTKVLRFFGVAYRSMAADQLLNTHPPRSRSKILCAAGDLLHLITRLGTLDADRFFETQVHSVFVYGANDVPTLSRLARILACDHDATIHELTEDGADVVVSDTLDDFCGVMSGVRAVVKASGTSNFTLSVTGENVINIISVGAAAAFLKFEYKGVPVFVSCCSEIIDLDEELKSKNFDVRKHFFGAVPIALYIKWAFGKTCWNAPQTNACLVIDDPVLKPRHGFVNFAELLSLMKKHKFSTNIAFIPWNFRRSSPEVVRLFKENPENYSISVHGSDHTRAEFGSSDERRPYWKAQQAIERMNHHKAVTGICHDRVMVFPHGIFSEAAMAGLKRTDLIGAVNNDIISADPHSHAVIFSELWDIAVMNYSSFSLFTRRYPWEGIENFAFDALLGKPAIIVIHHDYLSDHCARLISFIDRLNALKIPPTWRNLHEVLRRSYRYRELSSNEVEVQMYATELLVENNFGRPKRFLIRRQECDPSTIREISDESGPVRWSSANGYINFALHLKAGDSKAVRIRFHTLPGNGFGEDTLPHRFKAMLRRYLCEIRDNYITTARSRLRSPQRD